MYIYILSIYVCICMYICEGKKVIEEIEAKQWIIGRLPMKNGGSNYESLKVGKNRGKNGGSNYDSLKVGKNRG